MVWIVLVISLIYLVLLGMILKAYYRDVSDTNIRLIDIERRTVILEKFYRDLGGDNMACGGKKTKKATGKGGRKK